MAWMPAAAISDRTSSGAARSRPARRVLSVALCALLCAAGSGAAGPDPAAASVSRAEALKDIQRLLHKHAAGATGSAGASGATAAPKTSTAPGGGGAAAAAAAPGSSAVPGSTSSTSSTLTTTTSTSSTAPPVSAAPAGTAATHSDAAGTTISTPAIVLAGIAAVLLLISFAWALARALAYEPSWMPAMRHSFAEAGFRLSATFAELGDWLRIGR
jgi:hypothetical protein